MTPLLALKMRAYRNIAYHEDREAHFNRVNRVANFGILILGSAAAATEFATVKGWPAVAASAVAVLGGLQLVYDLGGRASRNHELRSRFVSILAQADMPGADVDVLNARMVEAYADELEVYHAVNSLAYNAAQKAFDRPEKEPIKVAKWRSLLRHWFTFTPGDFPDAQTI